MNVAAEDLKRAKARISDLSKWCQNRYVVDKNGYDCSARSDSAVRWCAIGSCIAENVCHEYLAKSCGALLSVSFINNNYGHAAVMKLYDRAIELAEKEEA